MKTLHLSKDLYWFWLSIVVLQMALSFVLGVYLGVGQISASPALIYLKLAGAGAVLVASVPIIFLFAYKKRVKVQQAFVRGALYIWLIAIGYFSLWFLVSLLLGGDPFDSLGSTVRALSPFLMFLALFFATYDSRGQFNLDKVFFISKIILVFLSLDILGKLVLVSSGYFYGGGLNQYSVAGYMLTYIFLLAEKKGFFKSLPLIILIALTIVLTVLSFKRSLWGLLVVNIFFIMIIRFKAKQAFLFLLLSAAAFVTAQNYYSDTFNDVTARLLYTFSGQGDGLQSLDASSYTRVAELISAYRTMLDGPYALSAIGGLGPAAGYNDYGFGLDNYNSSGELFHIHSFFGIVGFRYGILGLLFYSLIPVVAAIAWVKFGRFVRSETGIEYRVFVSSVVAILVSFCSSVSSNSLYGNTMIGVYLFLALSLFCHYSSAGKESKEFR